MKSTSLALLGFAASFAIVQPVAAQTIYKCTDASGGTLISNTRVDKNCKPVVTGPDISVPVPKAKSPGAAANPTPAGFPRVQDDTQKERDTDRRRILEQEMQTEQRSLEQARRDLAEQEAVKNDPRQAERLQPYRDRVAQHERNIQAIQREMSAAR